MTGYAESIVPGKFEVIPRKIGGEWGSPSLVSPAVGHPPGPLDSTANVISFSFLLPRLDSSTPRLGPSTPRLGRKSAGGVLSERRDKNMGPNLKNEKY
ncbi:hypothetical protein CRG98_002101 [Punica granatum]|uniref:Uncharacterized protein n=1 Tax=Punica granatum TaxID=22663 RepID=A0A2I0L9Y6_PUNGR|nr:hypothetical protein CRG98_002101 [Punica granatum]